MAKKIPKADLESVEVPDPKKPPKGPLPEFVPAPPPVFETLAEITTEEVTLEYAEDEGPAVTAHEANELKKLLAEQARRQIEALRLYEPLPEQEKFHRSKAAERLLRGSNRGGKTLPAAVEVARAVLGKDPYKKYPVRDGRAFLVGKDGKHLSQVMHKKLFMAGAFRIIRDAGSGRWRLFRPWDGGDMLREAEAKPAPPLIPPRMVQEIAWENKKERQPNLIRLRNGWELSFFSSLGAPPQGSDIDLCWFDEEIVDPQWYPEMAGRLLDRHGLFIWSATPQAGTEQLWDLHARAEEMRRKPMATVAEFVIRLRDNPHISDEQKKKFAEKLSEQDYEVRVEGEFAILSFKVYPEFSTECHCIDWFEVPNDWTRYAVIDPGRQVCAVLFAAIPPLDKGDFCYLYDELYLRNCSAEMFGQQMQMKCQGQQFQAFVIDHQGSRVTDTGSGRSIELQYSEALKKYKVKSESTGHGFVWGSSDKKAGEEAFRAYLMIRENGTAKLRVVRDKMKNFLWEIERFRYKRKSGQVTDDSEDRGRVHLMANSRYLAMFRPKYVKPKESKLPLGGAIKAFRAKAEKRKEQDGGVMIRLGPGKR